MESNRQEDQRLRLDPLRRGTARRQASIGALDVVRSLVRVAQLRHLETGAHLCRISHLVGALAFHRGFARQQIEMLRAAAALHDIGKITIADAILDKPGPLDADEWRVVKRHPLSGAALLPRSLSPLLQYARQIALCHHERWDGSGYPHGLRGEGIPLPARMVMLCDQYDALRSARPYKPAYGHATTCRILFEGDERTRPGHFDPRLLALFRRIHPHFESLWRRCAQTPPGLSQAETRRYEASGCSRLRDAVKRAARSVAEGRRLLSFARASSTN